MGNILTVPHDPFSKFVYLFYSLGIATFFNNIFLFHSKISSSESSEGHRNIKKSADILRGNRILLEDS